MVGVFVVCLLLGLWGEQINKVARHRVLGIAGGPILALIPGQCATPLSSQRCADLARFVCQGTGQRSNGGKGSHRD